MYSLHHFPIVASSNPFRYLYSIISFKVKPQEASRIFIEGERRTNCCERSIARVPRRTANGGWIRAALGTDPASPRSRWVVRCPDFLGSKTESSPYGFQRRSVASVENCRCLTIEPGLLKQWPHHSESAGCWQGPLLWSLQPLDLYSDDSFSKIRNKRIVYSFLLDLSVGRKTAWTMGAGYARCLRLLEEVPDQGLSDLQIREFRVQVQELKKSNICLGKVQAGGFSSGQTGNGEIYCKNESKKHHVEVC